MSHVLSLHCSLPFHPLLDMIPKLRNQHLLVLGFVDVFFSKAMSLKALAGLCLLGCTCFYLQCLLFHLSAVHLLENGNKWQRGTICRGFTKHASEHLMSA